MKVLQDHAILIQNLYLSKKYGARRLLSELPDKDRKHGSIDGLLKRICKTGKIVTRPGSGRPRSARSSSSGGPRAQWGRQAKKSLIISWDFAWNYHSLFKCAQDNSLWSPAQLFQMMSCSAVVWSQSHLSSHSLINNLTVCTKSCYCSFLNRKLNIK